MKTCNERAPLSPGQTLVDVFPARAPRVLSGSEAFVATSGGFALSVRESGASGEAAPEDGVASFHE